jgi:hypothetical protein
VDALVSQNIDFALEQFLKILLEANEIKQGSLVFHFDQQVDVTIGPVFAAGDGTEHAYVSRAMACGDTQDLVTVPINGHDSRSDEL